MIRKRLLITAVILLVPGVLFAADQSSLADLERTIAAQEVEIAKIKERARLDDARIKAIEHARATQQESAKTFVIPWDCSKYPAGAARNMCNEAHKELTKNSGTGSHESSHFINSMCRNMPQYRGKSGTCIHIGWDNSSPVRNPVVVWIDEPKNTSIKGLEVSGCIPGFLESCEKYKKYVVNSNVPPSGIRPVNFQPWTNLTYLFDEWGAYNIGAQRYIYDELRNAGKLVTRVSLDEVLKGPVAFTVMGASIAEYVKRNDPAYFATKEFQLFIKLQMENSMKMVREALMAQGVKGAFRDPKGRPEDPKEARRLIEQFKRSPQAELLRQMYGEAWFDRTFDISF